MKRPTEEKSQRLQWIQMTLAAKKRITTREVMARFEIGRSAAKEDLNYFKNYNAITWSSRKKCYLLVDELRSLPGLFISQKEWLVFTFTELMLKKHAASFSDEIHKFQERYKKDMNRLLPLSDINRCFSVNTTRTEEIDDAVFETCVYATVKQVVLRFEYP